MTQNHMLIVFRERFYTINRNSTILNKPTISIKIIDSLKVVNKIQQLVRKRLQKNNLDIIAH